MQNGELFKKIIIVAGTVFMFLMLFLIFPDFNEHKAYQRSTLPSLNRQIRSLEQFQVSEAGALSTPEEAAALKAQIENIQQRLREVIADDSVVLRRLSAKINMFLAGLLFFAAAFFIINSFVGR